MPRLVDFLGEVPGYKAFLEAAAGSPGRLLAPSFAHPVLAAGALASPPWEIGSVLVVAANPDAAEDLARELTLFLPARRVLHLPPRGVWYGPEGEVPPRVAGRRARAIEGLASGAVVVVEPGTLMEAVLLERRSALHFAVGAELPFDELTLALVELGYERVDQVEDPGEFSVRGGILDLFPSTETEPVRVEFWGDEVESLRAFSAYTQRSLETREQVTLYPAAEDHEAPYVGVLDLLPEDARVIRVDPGRAVGRIEQFRIDMGDVFEDHLDEERYLAWEKVEAKLDSFVSLTLERGTPREDDEPGASEAGAEPSEPSAAEPSEPSAVEPSEPSALEPSAVEPPTPTAAAPSGAEQLEPAGTGVLSLEVAARSGELSATNLAEAERELARLSAGGYRVVVSFTQRAEAERAGYILTRVTGRTAGPSEIPAEPGLTFLSAAHQRPFLLPGARLALVTEGQIFPRRRKAAKERRLVIGAELSSFRDLRKGDYVVHEDHGVGRFDGISTKTVSGVIRDYLDLAFKGGDMLYIPHDQIEKVSRYVGAGGGEPSLSKLGGRAWDQVKSRARKAVREMAGELLHLYAQRQTVTGYAYSEDGEWQRRFEMSFPYQETADQQRAIDAVKDDLEAPRPMDRLICGDVGYGKTEVALRGAFKAVMDGKQVMILVPTTILAQQHYGTFRERFDQFPVTVEMISRFRSPKDQKRIIKDFAEGRVDVLIGTHRLLSQDVKPKDLGLVILDEEQRFGVTQKELLRRLKLKVDVLTMSATPIPRTLQMSLAGVRDVSVIETPPRDRHPIQTYVGIYDEGMVKRAIEREIDRGGQVFYLHNRVETIDEAALRLRELLPNTRFGVAHGQMAEHELETVMTAFLRGDYDVLVTTTIIESGLDIPNANTLVVERADLLGLAQLYQLRGRIGRSNRVAHAFLFHPDEAALTEEAMARLSTLADYTELGAGFKVAMRDLEIRGAGNLLGDEQSGHVAAVGFEMYLSMLNETVEALQGREPTEEKIPRVDVGISAYVPREYIGYEAARVDLHRRIAAAESAEELQSMREELADRFGEIPEPVDNLIFLGEVRTALQKLEADSLSIRQQKLTVAGLRLPSGSRDALGKADRRYVYAPASGVLSFGLRGEKTPLRQVVEQILGDILSLCSERVQGAA